MIDGGVPVAISPPIAMLHAMPLPSPSRSAGLAPRPGPLTPTSLPFGPCPRGTTTATAASTGGPSRKRLLANAEQHHETVVSAASPSPLYLGSERAGLVPD